MVVAALGFDDDPFDPGGPEKLPLSIHTDAVWIWSESAAYFAARYALPPDPSLVRHIRRRDYRWPELDRTALERIGRQIRNGETG